MPHLLVTVAGATRTVLVVILVLVLAIAAAVLGPLLRTWGQPLLLLALLLLLGLLLTQLLLVPLVLVLVTRPPGELILGQEPERPLFRPLPPVVGAGLLRLLVLRLLRLLLLRLLVVGAGLLVLELRSGDHPTAGEVIVVAIGPLVAAGGRVLQLRAARAIAVDVVVLEAPPHWRWRVHRVGLRLLAVGLLGLEPLPVAVRFPRYLVTGELGSGVLS